MSSKRLRSFVGGFALVAALLTLPSIAAAVLPDLTASGVTGPAAARSGTVQTFGWTVTSADANASASVDAMVYLYLSLDTTFGAGDVLLANGTVSVAPGQSASMTKTLAIPPTVATGSYYLLAVVDPKNAVVSAPAPQRP